MLARGFCRPKVSCCSLMHPRGGRANCGPCLLLAVWHQHFMLAIHTEDWRTLIPPGTAAGAEKRALVPGLTLHRLGAASQKMKRKQSIRQTHRRHATSFSDSPPSPLPFFLAFIDTEARSDIGWLKAEGKFSLPTHLRR